MTVLKLARTAVVTVATGAVLLSGLAGAGAASAAPVKDGGGKSANENQVLNKPTMTVPHGRKLA